MKSVDLSTRVKTASRRPSSTRRDTVIRREESLGKVNRTPLAGVANLTPDMIRASLRASGVIPNVKGESFNKPLILRLPTKR